MHQLHSLERLKKRGADRENELFPVVEATPKAFFQRCRKLKDAFFASVYETVIGSVMAEAPSTYCGELSGLKKRFTAVWVNDRSRLAKIAHRRGEAVLEVVPKGVLLAGDRLFCRIRFFPTFG